MKRWAIADPHWQHKNILKYENRPFDSVDDMDLEMIIRWNSVVEPDHKVFCLGDIALASADWILWLSYQLRGELILIRGNHDRKSVTFYQSCGWQVFDRPMVWFEDKVVLSHARQDVTRGWLNIHGHSHSKGVDDDQHVCVSVENVNYTPVDLDELILKARTS